MTDNDYNVAITELTTLLKKSNLVTLKEYNELDNKENLILFKEIEKNTFRFLLEENKINSNLNALFKKNDEKGRILYSGFDVFREIFKIPKEDIINHILIKTTNYKGIHNYRYDYDITIAISDYKLIF
ncbi:hypothetical protein RU86_GL001041 [Lactococcus piscium]|uniref:Uncharacterized protein n=1 Tax=Pseudolactococcus piscium TaxID=1364 RepID=A0A2A5S569_9LACT|nr:hypothetical protein [Lactococcus piscium]PCS08657.1 hypothetical protein RU86_GL001041 [Lactococcus piscium]